MADQYRKLTTKHPGDLARQFKSLGFIGENGEEVFAEVLALESLSIGGGGAGTPNYTEGDIDSTITGVATMWEDTGNTLRAISAAFPLPVNVVAAAGGGLTDAQLRATPVPVSGPLTDTQLRATAVPVSGPLTDTQLRASAVSVADTRLPSSFGQKTMANSLAVVIASDQSAVPVSGPLTDTQLRASAVPVSGPLTDIQLRASAVPVSIGSNGVVALNQAYTEGDTDGTITGIAMLWEDAADTLRAVSAAKPLPIGDAGGSLTVDGTVTANAGTGPFPVSDNAGSLTVDAPVGTPVFSRLSDGTAALTTTGGRLSVDASGVAVPVTDNAGTLTVDAPVGTPVFVRLSDGAAALIGQKAMAASLPVVVASDQSRMNVSADGDIDHDVANTLKNIQIAGHASPVDIPPTVVSASGDRVRAHFDRYGANVVRRRKIRESYTAVCRLAEAAARLDQTFTQVANTNKQWATLHHTAGATKEVRLQKCIAYITSDTTAGIQGIFELRQISAAPATGNPAITPTPARRGGTAAEAVVLYLPTTAGTEANVNSPLGHVPFDTGISGAVSTVNPVPILTPVVLYDASTEDDEMLPPTLPVATLDGWAVVVRTVGAPVLRVTVVWKFTEEIP